MRTLMVFVLVAVAGMALLPETPAVAGVGKDPATAFAPVRSFDEVTVSEAGTFPIPCSEACGDGRAEFRGTRVVTTLPR